jgi:membrane protein DedA with SNARE-associated domain
MPKEGERMASDIPFLRIIAGIFVGSGALMLLNAGEYVAAGTILGTMLGFFVGERNGMNRAKNIAG